MRILLLCLAIISLTPWALASPAVTVGSKGIEFREPDERYEMRLRFRMQNRLEYESVSDNDLNPDLLTGNIRRLRLRLDGFALAPEFRYKIQLSFSRNDLDWDNTGFPNIIRDAAVLWQATPWFQLVFGLTKLPGNRQRVISSGELQFPDRSLISSTFNMDRDFGFQGRFDQTWGTVPWNIQAAITTGDGRNQVISGFGLAYTTRLEILPLGSFQDGGDSFEGDLAYEETPKLAIAGGYSYNKNATRTGGQIGTDLGDYKSFGTGFGDVLLKYRGYSLYGEIMGRAIPDPVVSSSSYVYQGAGFLLQTGYCFRNFWEPAIRFARLIPGEEIRALTPRRDQLSVGLSKYIREHRIKVQADVTREWTENLSTSALGGSYAGRLQLELGI